MLIRNAMTLGRVPLLCLLVTPVLLAQDRKVDPTWLHRYVPSVSTHETDFTTKTCHYEPIFGEGDVEKRPLQSVARFGAIHVDNQGDCGPVLYERREELLFVLEGSGTLHYRDQTQPLAQHDFAYVSPSAKHAISNNSRGPLRVLLMSFKIPTEVPIDPAPATINIANLESLKEQPVEGHPTSVLYKLMVGPRTSTRDAIRAAYVVTSLFWMDFAPGGTNFPHHHEFAEEIYLVVDGQGDIVAGAGMDGVEGRHPAKAGDAYYFRPNCTVGFYNQSQPGAKAHIIAVRSRVPLPKDVE
jgi:mannose-6-phosphate isomerase-like protein (cupin superfamily)